MKDGLLVVERMLLESIDGGNQTVEKLKIDTGLSENLIHNILKDLMAGKVVTHMANVYALSNDKKIRSKWNHKKAIREEVKELFVSLVNQYFYEEEKKTRLRVRKVWLTPFEEKILNSHFQSLENFITDLEKSKKKGPSKQRRVILWGEGVYGDLVERLLDVA